MDILKKTNVSFMEAGYAVAKDVNKGQWEMVAIFNGWVEAHNYLIRNIGVNRGRIVEVKGMKGITED